MQTLKGIDMGSKVTRTNDTTKKEAEEMGQKVWELHHAVPRRPVRELLVELDISRSGYYQHLERMRQRYLAEKSAVVNRVFEDFAAKTGELAAVSWEMAIDAMEGGGVVFDDEGNEVSRLPDPDAAAKLSAIFAKERDWLSKAAGWYAAQKITVTKELQTEHFNLIEQHGTEDEKTAAMTADAPGVWLIHDRIKARVK